MTEINYEEYLKEKKWSLFKAVCLINGENPDEYGLLWENIGTVTRDRAIKAIKNKELRCADEGNKNKECSYVFPRDFINWCIVENIQVTPELKKYFNYEYWFDKRYNWKFREVVFLSHLKHCPFPHEIKNVFEYKETSELVNKIKTSTSLKTEGYCNNEKLCLETIQKFNETPPEELKILLKSNLQRIEEREISKKEKYEEQIDPSLEYFVEILKYNHTLDFNKAVYLSMGIAIDIDRVCGYDLLIKRGQHFTLLESAKKGDLFKYTQKDTYDDITINTKSFIGWLLLKTVIDLPKNLKNAIEIIFPDFSKKQNSSVTKRIELIKNTITDIEKRAGNSHDMVFDRNEASFQNRELIELLKCIHPENFKHISNDTIIGYIKEVDITFKKGRPTNSAFLQKLFPELYQK